MKALRATRSIPGLVAAGVFDATGQCLESQCTKPYDELLLTNAFDEVRRAIDALGVSGVAGQELDDFLAEGAGGWLSMKSFGGFAVVLVGRDRPNHEMLQVTANVTRIRVQKAYGGGRRRTTR